MHLWAKIIVIFVLVENFQAKNVKKDLSNPRGNSQGDEDQENQPVTFDDKNLESYTPSSGSKKKQLGYHVSQKKGGGFIVTRPRIGVSGRRFENKEPYVTECKGVYEMKAFSVVDRVCYDCYNLFRDPTLHELCGKNCFRNDHYPGCLGALRYTEEEIEQIKVYIKQINGADPEV